MILDQFGRPIRPGNRLHTPAWVVRDTVRVLNDREAERRVQVLRNEIAFAGAADGALHAGETIRVKVPRRYDAQPVAFPKNRAAHSTDMT